MSKARCHLNLCLWVAADGMGWSGQAAGAQGSDDSVAGWNHGGNPHHAIDGESSAGEGWRSVLTIRHRYVPAGA